MRPNADVFKPEVRTACTKVIASCSGDTINLTIYGIQFMHSCGEVVSNPDQPQGVLPWQYFEKYTVALDVVSNLSKLATSIVPGAILGKQQGLNHRCPSRNMLCPFESRPISPAPPLNYLGRFLSIDIKAGILLCTSSCRCFEYGEGDNAILVHI